MSTVEKLRELRFDRMRLGQSTGEYVSLLSHPEIQVALVPLTEAEHSQCIQIITDMEAPDNIAGAMARDRRNANEVLYRAIRNPENLEEKMFESLQEMMELLEVGDVNYLMDMYLEKAESDNPTPSEFTDDELDEIKKVLAGVDWNGLSGRQWYALRRFLSLIGVELLPASSLGSTLIKSSTTMNDEVEFTNNAA